MKILLLIMTAVGAMGATAGLAGDDQRPAAAIADIAGYTRRQPADARLTKQSIRSSQCAEPTVCSDPSAVYRSADGSCNNLINTDYGRSNTKLERILPPTYDDQQSEPRTHATDQSLLPGARVISSTLFPELNKPSHEYTLALMEFSQFLDNDISHTPFDSTQRCCPDDPDTPLSSKCFAIDLTGDTFFSQHAQTCMNFIRSTLASGPTGTDCLSDYAEQVNEITHWMDASTVYGSSQEEQEAVRSFTSGALKTDSNNMLPINPNPLGACRAEQHEAQCILAGDPRANMEPGLTAMHVMWMREHNYIAQRLSSLHPEWDDETLFQEARRFVTAELQNIAYSEFLPLIIGPAKMVQLGLDFNHRGYKSEYSETTNPSIINEFSAAAFRFGHSLVPGKIFLLSEDGLVDEVSIRDNYQSPHLIQVEGRLDDLVRGLVKFPSQSFDNFFTEELTNHLFQQPDADYGFDLVSINIQRGRDHGLPTYNDVREECGLPRITDFDGLMHVVSRLSIIGKLKNLYKSVDDIDLFVGGLSEKAVSGGLVGPTFACIIGEQFARLMKGDRFFYNLQDQPGSFTSEQISELRRSSFARFICDNTGVSAIQPHPFLLATHKGNFPVPCDSPIIPSLDITIF